MIPKIYINPDNTLKYAPEDANILYQTAGFSLKLHILANYRYKNLYTFKFFIYQEIDRAECTK